MIIKKSGWGGINLQIKTVEEQINEIRQVMIKRYLNEKIDDLSRDLSIEENDVNGYHGCC